MDMNSNKLQKIVKVGGACPTAVHGVAKKQQQKLQTDLEQQQKALDRVFPDDSVVKNLLANAGDTGDAGSIPGSGRSPGVGNGSPLQYSCLEKPHGQEPGML